MYGSVGHMGNYVYRVIYISDGNMNDNYSQSWVDNNTDYQCLNNQLVTDLANEITLNCNSDLEKAIAIHDYVLRMRYRDYYNGFNNAYKSLLLFEGNCVDQSNAFMALAKKAGLTVRGICGSPQNSGVGHAWTQVKIDNKWVVAELTGYNFGCWLGSETYSRDRLYFVAFDKDIYYSQIQNR